MVKTFNESIKMFIPFLPNNVGSKSIMFSGCTIIPFILSFIRTDIVNTISYE